MNHLYYNYHEITGEFLGSADAFASPTEPGTYLIPANSTELEPPTAQPNKTAVFKDGAWSRVSDFRNTEAWKRDTGEKVLVTELGTLNSLNLTELPYPEYPATWNGTAWEADIAKMQGEKLLSLSDSAAAAYVAGFTSAASGTSMFYDSDPETQALLSNVYMRTKETDWETKVRYPGICEAGKAPIRARPNATSSAYEKTIQQLDADQIKLLIDDLDAAFYAIKVKLWGLQVQTVAAVTVEDINSIVW